MKKILFFVLILAGLAGAGWLYTRSASTPDTAEYYAGYLPHDTMSTVSLLDLKGLSERFPTTSFGKFLAKPAIHSILTDLGAPEEVQVNYDHFYDGFADVMTNPAFRQIFGDDAVIAFLAPDVTQIKDDPEKELRKSLLVFGTSSVSGALDSFAKLVMSSNVETLNVDGLEITRIQLEENQEIYGASDKNVLVLGGDPNVVAAAIKRHDNGNTLKQSLLFSDVVSFWSATSKGQEYARLFYNFPVIQDLLSKVPEEDARQIAEYFTGFKAMGAVIYSRQNDLYITNRVDYDYDALNPLIQKHYLSVSEKNSTLGLLTPGTLAYYWTSLLSKEYLEFLLSSAPAEQSKKIDSALQKELGVTLDEVMSAFGPQMGMTLNSIVNTGLFPLPKLVAFIQVKDLGLAEKITNALRKKIAEQGMAEEKKLVVNGKTIYYWSVLPGEATQPAFVLTENMLYIANGKSVLAKLVDSNATPEKLPSSMEELTGSELATAMKKSNYGMYVMRPDRFATEIREAADWLAGMISMSRDVSIDHLKDELLQLMHATDIVVATSDINKKFTTSTMVLKATASSSSTQ